VEWGAEAGQGEWGVCGTKHAQYCCVWGRTCIVLLFTKAYCVALGYALHPGKRQHSN
jgi:hypothetical protein